ncbi:uncharacterized protein [Haliotis asinina]|uniref:uncharacterized protein n=1 Tax=Haliotis asinina TaxID=109174 RepID=UPI00353253F6
MEEEPYVNGETPSLVMRAGSSSKECAKGASRFSSDGTTCQACYTGTCCSDYVRLKPNFEMSYQVTELTADQASNDDIVYNATACVSADCPCDHIVYTLEDDTNTFKIDPSTGVIRVLDSSRLKRQHYTVTVIAENKDDSDTNAVEMTLSIKSLVGEANDAYSNGNNNGYEHHISKRAAGDPPANVTFDLIKLAPHTNKTEMRVGQKISFELTITFPTGTTDMLVELFTPDNETIIMMLCGVKVKSKGKNIQLDGTEVPELHSIDNNLYIDRAVINLGNVTNSGLDTASEANNQIVINYDAVMLDTVPNNGSKFWVSAGAEYNDEADVWVGQASFICITDVETFSATPTINFTGPDQMSIGSSAVFRVDIYMPYPAVTLSFDAFAPLNTSNVMSICAVKGKDVAVNYDCGFDITSPTHTLHKEGNVKGNSRAHLEIGKAINKGMREAGNSDADNRLTLEFVAHLFEDDSFVGQDYWLGAALEIGTNQIWAGQLKITVIAKVPGSSTGVTFPVPSAVTEKTSENKPVIIEAVVEVPESSTNSYKLEVLGPLDGSQNPLLQVCSVRVSFAGNHLPCVDLELEAEYKIRKEGGTVVDSAILDLKRVTNVGQWSSINTTADSNMIKFQVLVKGTNISLTGAPHNVDLGLYVEDTRIQLRQVSIDVEAASPIADVANDSVPTMKMQYTSGGENVYVGSASKVALEITTARNVLLPVMDIEFIMPNDTASDGHSPITICRTEVISAGRNLPCATKSVINKAVQYAYKYVEGLSDRTIINLASLCNFEVTNDTAEDKLVLETVVQLHDHSSFSTNASQHWISAGVMFSEKMMWVGQLGLNALTTTGLEAVTPPYITYVNNGSAQTPVGYAAVYTLIIKTAPTDSAYYTVNVTTSDAKLSICSVRIIAKGYNLPCVKEDVKNVLSKDSPTGPNNKASLDMGIFSNVGTSTLISSPTFDDNTVMVEIVVQLSKDAADGGNHDFNILTTYGTQTNSQTVTVQATTSTAGINTTVNNASTISIGVLPITNTDNSSEINKGQAKRIFLDIFVPLSVTQELTAKVMAPIALKDVLQVRYMGLLEKGDNMPCLSHSQTTVDYVNRTLGTNSDFAIASIGLGFVCNIGLEKVDSMANRIRLEAVIRVLKNATVNPGDKITLSGSLNTNNQQIAIVQHDLTIVDSFTDILPENMTLSNDTAIKVNVTEDPLYMKINEEKTIPIQLIIPPFVTTIVKFDVDLPVNDSAVMTFKSIKVTGSGINLAGYGYSEELTITEKSTRNTSQIDKAYIDMGIVTNAGSTHRIDQQQYEDDIISMDLTVVMADSLANTNNSEHWISLGVKIGIYIVILEYKVVTMRDGTEKPCIEFTGEVDYSGSTTTQVVINGLLRHDNESTAESINMTALLLFPPFLQFSSLTNLNDSRIDCSETHDDNMMKLRCGAFYFTDVLAFTVTLQQHPTYKVPTTVQGINTVITLATAAKTHLRAVNTYNDQVDFSCNMNYVNHTVAVVQETATTCTVTSLLTGSGILDARISGSPDHYTGGEPVNGRIGGTGFSPFVRPGTLKQQRYFQVYIGNKASIQKIKVEAGSGVGFGSTVTKIKPAFSNDGYAWIEGAEITVPSVPSEVTVGDSVESRYIRIYIVDDSDSTKKLGVTFDLMGCLTSNDVASSDTDKGVYEEAITNTEWHRSGFLHDGSNLFVCDAAVDDGLKQACYKTADGDTWKRMDERLGCMIGHDPSKGEIYALGNDGVTYMSSEDNGNTWASVRKEKFDTAKATSTFKEPKKVKWEENPALQAANPDASLTDGNWGATAQGIHKNNGGGWDVKFNWASCCGK